MRKITRTLAPTVVVVMAVVLAGCTNLSGQPGIPDTGQALTSASPKVGDNVTAVTIQEAREQFLLSVCPTDTALQNLNSVATSVGGWANVFPEDVQPFSEGALRAIVTTNRSLESISWPVEIAGEIPDVIQEHSEMVFLLERMTLASGARRIQAAWDELRGLPRETERRVRMALGLGQVWSQNDGCPPPPPVSEADATRPSGRASSAGWTTLWQSPSGNLRCGFAPRGSRDVPVVACLDSDTNTLARLPRGYFPSFTSATSSQRSQLPGGFVLEFYQSVSEYGFECSLQDEGMVCVDNSSGAGFVIRRGAAYSI